MIIIDHETLNECVEKLDESIELITTLVDSSLGQAIDEIVEVRTILMRGIIDYERNIDDMAEYYGEEDE